MEESDSDGTFRLGAILPRDYVLRAIKDDWDLEWSKSDILGPYLSAGQEMSIAANQSVKATVSAQQGTAASEQKLPEGSPTKRLKRRAAPDPGPR